MWEHLQGIERKRVQMPPLVRMRLNRLEKPEPWPKALRQQIAAAMGECAAHQYPAYPAFQERLAVFHGVPSARLTLGAGIEEFIRNLFMLAGGKVAYLWPTCAMFDLYARIFNLPVQRIVTDPARDMGADEIAAKLDPDVRLLLLTNPGQPVDVCQPLEGLRTLARWCEVRGATLAVDEAYSGFGAPSGFPLVNEFDRVTILRTFSKAFGAASIRLGFAVSSPKVHAELNGVRQSGEVSSASMAAASVLMDNFGAVVESIHATIIGREALAALAAQSGVKTRGSNANHLLIDWDWPNDLLKIGQGLWNRGILTKFDFPEPLHHHMLVTCGSPELMVEFWEAVQDVKRLYI
jgi:histidinol-phosphate/aromatic aminotransferase/cobyric acid decarboxylase-like protein